jgi:hypothetical protein
MVQISDDFDVKNSFAGKMATTGYQKQIGIQICKLIFKWFLILSKER